jgi:Xaa-Pro aminopeptidase
VQQELERLIKPGLFLRNSQAPELSIHHIAVKMFAEAGLEKYFPHSIGHFLGLDTHDVGDYLIALAPGDAFTLEPGLYIPEERIGVRIEDDYVLTEDGLVCLSDTLPKEVEEVEELLLAAAEATS